MKSEILIKEIEDKETWEGFNLSRPHPAYFQSWDWGEVQKKAGVTVYREGIFKDSSLIGIAQIFEVKAKRGHFFHIRQGPVLEDWGHSVVNQFLSFVKDLSKNSHVSYIRISPLLKEEEKSASYLREIGFRESPIHHVDAENRWVLDLQPELETILLNMRKTTRYMIRKGEREEISITCSQSPKDLEKFLEIYQETAELKHFVPHSLIKEEFEEFKKDGKAYVYLAEVKKKVLGGAIITYYGPEAIYRHGATSHEGRNTPASYYLQWQAIKDARERGLSLYNFWGIAKDDNPSNPWFGLTQFKKGFGGEQVNFVHSMDYPLTKKYWASFLIDYYTKLKKGY